MKITTVIYNDSNKDNVTHGRETYERDLKLLCVLLLFVTEGS